MAEKDNKDPEQDNLIREIEEELRQENLNKLWKKYGNVVMGAAVLLVVSVAGFKGWQSYDNEQRAKAAAVLIDATRAAETGKPQDALAALTRLGDDAPGGYAMLARFQAAALLAKSGDKTAAATAYGALAEDTGVDALYRDLAAVLAGLNEVDTADPASLRQRMARITDDTNPWRYSAREIMALTSVRSGNKAEARSQFEALAKDPATPTSLRQRAEAMALHLKD